MPGPRRPLRPLVLALALGASACTSTPAPPRSHVPASEEAADDEVRAAAALQIVHRTGLDAQLGALATVGELWGTNLERVVSMLPEHERPDPEVVEHAHRLGQAAAAAYDGRALERRVRELLAAGPSRHLIAGQRHLTSSAAERIAVLRAELGTGPGQQRLARFLADARGAPPDAVSLGRAERAVAASREVDLVVLMTWDASAGFARSVSALLPPELASGPAPIGEREAFVEAVQRQVLWRTLFLHAAAGEEAADVDVQWWESEAGAWLATGRLDAVRRALLESETRASEAARKMHKVRPPSPPDGEEPGPELRQEPPAAPGPMSRVSSPKG